MYSSIPRAVRDHKHVFLAACECLSWQMHLPPLGVLKGTAGLRNMTANAAGADSPEEVTPQPQEPKEQPSEVVSKSKEESEVVTHKYPGLQRLIQARPRNDDQSAFTLGLYSAAVGSDVATIALQSGVNISGSEMGLFHGALSSDFYTELKDEERMYPPGVMEDMQMEVLRRSNISMPCKKNQRVYGTVYALDRKRVFIDAGHSNLAQLNRQVRSLRHLSHTIVAYNFTILSCCHVTAISSLPAPVCRSCLCGT